MNAETIDVKIGPLLQYLNESYFAATPLVKVNRVPYTVGAQFRDLSLRTKLRPVLCGDKAETLGVNARTLAYRGIETVVLPSVLSATVGQSDRLLFDRLCRAMHILNFAVTAKRGLLFLPIPSAGGQANDDAYGEPFDRLLRSCEMVTNQVVMQLNAAALKPIELECAAHYYRQRGYRIGIVGVSFDTLIAWVSPPIWVDYINLQSTTLQAAAQSSVIRRNLALRMKIVHQLTGAKFLATGLQSATQIQLAKELGASTLAGDTLEFNVPQWDRGSKSAKPGFSLMENRSTRTA